MRLPWKKSKPDREPEPEGLQEKKVAASFGGNLEDFALLRHHAVRALCGLLMDRHTACRSPHPFCRQPGHRQAGDVPMMLITEAVPQRSDTSTSNLDLIGIYLCPAAAVVGSEEHGDVMDLIMRMTPSQPTPNRKIVVAPRKVATIRSCTVLSSTPSKETIPRAVLTPTTLDRSTATPNHYIAAGSIGRVVSQRETGSYPGSTACRPSASGGSSTWTGHMGWHSRLPPWTSQIIPSTTLVSTRGRVPYTLQEIPIVSTRR